MAIVEEGEYKGQPMLKLQRTDNDRFPFQFGMGKAKLILECIDEIKEFVKKNDKPKEDKPKEEKKKKKKSEDEE